MGLIRLFGGASGVTNQPQGLDIGIGGGNIKSIQRGTTTGIVAGQATQDIPISKVDPNKSIVLIENTAGTAFATKLTLGQLTSETNLRLTRDGTTGLGATIFWQVVEFENIKSLQKGVTNIATTGAITISSVNTLKTITFNSGLKSSAASTSDLAAIRMNLSSATNINVVVAGGEGGYTADVGWQVVEFN